MNNTNLGFALIHKIEHDLAEVVVNEGVELDMIMLSQYHQWIEQNLTDPCFLLINKINRYTYTFEAQQNLVTLNKVKAIAIVCYTTSANIATHWVINMSADPHWQVKTFECRKNALQWLNYCQTELLTS